MSNCKHCKADCAHRGEEREHVCMGYIAMTNADRIRAMTDEELAELLEEAGDDMIAARASCWLDWLKQPCGGADHE